VLGPWGFTANTLGIQDQVFADWWRESCKRTPKDKKKKGFNSVVILGAWILWKNRNSYVFQCTRPCMENILHEFQDEQHHWCLFS
jgi:hypothetical protein